MVDAKKKKLEMSPQPVSAPKSSVINNLKHKERIPIEDLLTGTEIGEELEKEMLETRKVDQMNGNDMKSMTKCLNHFKDEVRRTSFRVLVASNRLNGLFDPEFDEKLAKLNQLYQK